MASTRQKEYTIRIKKKIEKRLKTLQLLDFDFMKFDHQITKNRIIKSKVKGGRRKRVYRVGFPYSRHFQG